MSVVVERDDRQESILHEGGKPGKYQMQLSREEMQMIMHLRMLGGGVHAVRLVKAGRGQALREFRFTEIAMPRMKDEG